MLPFKYVLVRNIIICLTELWRHNDNFEQSYAAYSHSKLSHAETPESELLRKRSVNQATQHLTSIISCLQNAPVFDNAYRYHSLIERIMNKYKTLLYDNIFTILSVILSIHLKLVTEITKHFSSSSGRNLNDRNPNLNHSLLGRLVAQCISGSGAGVSEHWNSWLFMFSRVFKMIYFDIVAFLYGILMLTLLLSGLKVSPLFLPILTK